MGAQWQRNKSLKSGERTLRLIAMWLKSTGWISPIKTKARRGFILSQGIKMWHAAFSLFLLSLPSCSRKVSQKNLADWGESRLRGVDSVTAVTKHCQLLLSHVYFDSATLKASASWSRCANLHNSEVYSVMLRRCYSCCARPSQNVPSIKLKLWGNVLGKHLQGHHRNTKAFN